MLADHKNVTMNYDQEYIQYNGLAFPFSMFGLESANNYTDYNLTYFVKSTYDTPDGKFSQIYGNVALIDCAYLADQIIDELFVQADEYRKEGNITEEQYFEIFALLTEINDYARENDVTFCKLAYQMIGVLKDQASYYLTTYSDIREGIDVRAEEITGRLTLNTNISISAPLESQFKSTSSISAFLDGTLFTIIIFLGILSAMLLYSLMLSDVDSKTYDYAMLRALGFRKRMLVVMIVE